MDFIRKHKWEVPLYIIAAGLPLIIYFHVQYTGLENLPWFPNQVTWTDFFLYGKSRCVHLTALLMAIILIAAALRKRTYPFGREWILVFIFGALQLASAFTSIAPQQSFLGGIEQYESVWVLLGYLVIGCYAYQCVVKSKSPKMILNALFVGVALSCLIGITQLFQMDFWESSIGKYLLVPDTYAEFRESLRFNFSQGNWEPVYLAGYNPNYAGIYLLMILPCMFLGENRVVRILGIIVAICMLGTLSKTVMVVAMILVVMGFVLFGKLISPKDMKWKYVAAVIIIFLGITLLFLNGNEEAVSEKEKLQEVVCDEEYVRLKYQDETILFREKTAYEGGITYELLYEDGSLLDLLWNETSGEMDPQEEKLQGLHFKVYEKDGIAYAMFRYGDIPFRFTKDAGTGKYEYVTINGKLDQLQNAPAIFIGHEDFINGRGYIWSRTLPKIAEYPLLGTGPDTFLLAFPQDDYVARSNLGHTFFTQILTNAHSLYMHMTVQTGIPSLLCFLGFVLLYLKKSWKLYYGKETYSELEKVGIGILLGIIGYLLCGLTFASSVCTTPIFWLLLGTGIGINKRLSNESRQALIFNLF